MSDTPRHGERDDGPPLPLHAEFQHRAVTARVQDEVGHGQFANAAVVLSGQFEFVIDFLQRLSRPEQVVTRVVLPIPVVEQFVLALRESLENYEKQFGRLPDVTRPAAAYSPSPPNSVPSPEPGHNASAGPGAVAAAPTGGGNKTDGFGPPLPVQEKPSSGPERAVPTIDDIYGELRLDDHLLGGKYANAVLIRHSMTEFCFDFVSNIYPRSSVNARVFMAAPQVPSLLNSIAHSCQQYRRRMGPQ